MSTASYQYHSARKLLESSLQLSRVSLYRWLSVYDEVYASVMGVRLPRGGTGHQYLVSDEDERRILSAIAGVDSGQFKSRREACLAQFSSSEGVDGIGKLIHDVVNLGVGVQAMHRMMVDQHERMLEVYQQNTRLEQVLSRVEEDVVATRSGMREREEEVRLIRNDMDLLRRDVKEMGQRIADQVAELTRVVIQVAEILNNGD